MPSTPLSLLLSHNVSSNSSNKPFPSTSNNPIALLRDDGALEELLALEKQFVGTVVDLFCGAGGLGLGFRAQGFRIVWAADASAPAVETYQRKSARSVIVKRRGSPLWLPNNRASTHSPLLCTSLGYRIIRCNRPILGRCRYVSF
ncbi:DNA cytosine methyltransferase [Myxococcota bacterium]|nr:DNA cytosine methyltransferase [Myxococcota bacterium]